MERAEMTMQSPYYSNLPKGSRPEELGAAGRIRSLIDIKQKAIQQDRNRIARELAGSGSPDMVRQEFAERESRLMAEIGQLQQQLQAIESGGTQTPGRLASPLGDRPMTTRDGIEAGTALGVDARVLQDLAAGVISQEEAVAILTQRYGPERAQRMLQSAGGPAGSRMDQPQGGQMPPGGTPPPSQPRTMPTNAVPTAQPRQITGPTNEAGTGFQAGGPAQTGPGYPAADPSLMGGADFGFGSDPQLRDIYPGLFESIQLGNFIDQTFPGVGGGFRNFLENQSGMLNAAYNLAGLTGGLTPGGPESTSDFGTFLSQLPRQGMNIGVVPGMDMLNQAANVLRGGTQGLGGGELDPNTGLPVGGSPGSDLQFEFLRQVAGNPLQQLMMALAPRMANLPGWARGAFFGAGRDAMNSILAQQGTNLGAGGLPQELLPILQQRGFNPFGG